MLNTHQHILVGADCMYKIIVSATWHSQHLLLLAANTIIFCFCDGAQLKSLYKMAASLNDKRTPITTPPYQLPSVDITPDPPIYSLVTTFKNCWGRTEAQFLVPDWGMMPAMASGCRTVPPLAYSTVYSLAGPVRHPDAIAGFIIQ